jgi:hypothetical protein
VRADMAPRENDSWAIGILADGSIPMLTQDEAPRARIERDVFDAVFEQVLALMGGLLNAEDHSRFIAGLRGLCVFLDEVLDRPTKESLT